MIETLVTAPIPGGARSYDRVFPAPQSRNVGNAHAFYTMFRQGFVTDTDWSAVSIGLQPPGGGFQLYKGRVAYNLSADGASGEVCVNNADYAVFTTAGGARQKGDFHCWRFLLIAAANNIISAVTDLGVECCIGSSGDVVVSGASLGFAIQIVSQAACRFVARNGAAFTINQTLASDLDTREYNAYELRVCSATDTADGYVKALVNGVQRGVWSWGAGTGLPTSLNTANCMLRTCISNRGAASGLYVPVAGFRMSAGPTEQATL